MMMAGLPHQGAKAHIAQADAAEEHAHGQQRHDGDDPVHQRDAEVLHGHRGQIRQQHRQHQFNRFQLADLPLAGEPKPHNV